MYKSIMLPTECSLVLSPINKKTSGADYDGQVAAYNQGKSMRWDDSYKNLAKIGDYFAFTFHKSKVLFYTIVAIEPPAKRPEEWNDPKHKTRQVIVLSDMIHELDWSAWIALDGHKRPNGTTHLRDGLRTSAKFIALLNIIMSRKALRECIERERLEKSMIQLIDSTRKQTEDLNAKWVSSLLSMAAKMTIIVSSDEQGLAPLRIIDLQFWGME